MSKAKTKKYIVSEQIFVCYEVEAKSALEARDKYSELTPEQFNELIQDAITSSWSDVNVEEAPEEESK